MTRRRNVHLTYGRVDAQGRRLCCHCGAPIGKGRRDWCSDECAQRYLIATGDQGACRRWIRDAQNPGWRTRSNPGHLQVVCELCRVDCAPLTPPPLLCHGYWPATPLRWEADHRVPIVEGGALAPENLRCLCRSCHKRVTAELRARLAARRREVSA